MSKNGLEIILFTEGDANSVDTWSNIPYFLAQNLELLGATVHKIDIGVGTSSRIERTLFYCLNLAARCMRKIIGNNPIYELNRTAMWERSVNRKMKAAFVQYPNTKVSLAFTFSHSAAHIANCPTWMLCDWPIEYLIEIQQKRIPGVLEKAAIRRQIKEILAADHVVTLFPDVQEYMQRKYKREILYLGNVINSDLIAFSENEIIDKKKNSNHYLFIGREKYKKSAIVLAQVAAEYNKVHKEKIFIDIIGLTQEVDPVFSSDYVKCYGYLSKADKQQKEIYYECILRAKAIVNTTKYWNGMSSLIEAMYYNTPVITIPNPSIRETFGENCDFGVYCENDTEEEILGAVSTIQTMSETDYTAICYQCYERVKDFTWSNYAKKMLTLFEKEI